jgi:predicted MFS family arabinose efflux permease
MRLRPDPYISEQALEHGKVNLVRDSALASLAGSLYGGVILVGFALTLGASPFVIGLLAALPLLAQAAQLPAIALVERIRQRRKIAVISVTLARVFILLLPLIPFAAPEARLDYLIAAELAITVFGSIAACALNSWLHQLLPRDGLGAFFARRLFWGTTLTCAGALAAGQVVDRWTGEVPTAYALIFGMGAVAGFLSSWFLSRVPEPPMDQAGPTATIAQKIRAPFGDADFRRVIVFMGAWNVASNLAAPFIAVYLMQQLEYSLSTVMGLLVASQLSNAFTVFIWGRVSDRLSNKAVLRLAVPMYFACMLGLVFTAMPEQHRLTLPLLAVLHVVMGMAAGGVALACANISLKLAPAGQGTAYLAAISLTVALAGGIAPMLGGAVAQLLEAAELSAAIRWISPRAEGEFIVVSFAHWQFLFAFSAAAGFYVMHALSRIREAHEISQREVVQALAIEAARTVNQLSTIGGLISGLVAFGRLIERRIVRRR